MSDQRNGGPEHYQDMKLGVIPRVKVDPRYLAKLQAEYVWPRRSRASLGLQGLRYRLRSVTAERCITKK